MIPELSPITGLQRSHREVFAELDAGGELNPRVEFSRRSLRCARCFPYSCCAIPACRSGEAAIGTQRHRSNTIAVSEQRTDRDSRSGVPAPGGAIVTAGQNREAVAAQRHIAD